MEKPGKRGKIPQQDWPSIITRYESGETLASIARTYDCSPPAISYIVSRSRARGAAPAAEAPAEPQRVKAHPIEPAAASAALSGNSPASTPAGADSAGGVGAVGEPRLFSGETLFASEPQQGPTGSGNVGSAERHRQPRHDPNPSGNGPSGNGPSGNGNAPRPGAPPHNGEARRTLHLSLADSTHRIEPAASAAVHGIGTVGSGERQPPRTGGDPEGNFAQLPRQGAGPFPARNDPRPANEGPRAKDSAAFIDQALRERVDGDIAAFLAAFDAALADDTMESRAGLREATDRLLRAGARTRIELERLEARLPLPPRDKNAQAAPAFRPR